MRGIILAAGRGSRMASLTKYKPKGLVKFNNRCLVDYQIQAMKKAGIQDLAFCTGYRHTMFEEFNFRTFHNPNWNKTNMVYSLIQARSWLRNHDCVISYSDIFFTENPVKELVNCSADIAIAYDPDWLNLWSMRFADPKEDAETFRFDKVTDNLTEIGGTIEDLSNVEGQYMGLFKIRPAGWKAIETLILKYGMSTFETMDMTSLFSLLIKENYIVKVCSNFGTWGEIDTAEDLRVYEKNLNYI